MKKNKVNSIIATVCLSSLIYSTAYSVEVYYLGGGVDNFDEDQTANESFELSKRAKDLVNFGSYGDYGNDRSGMISGSIEQTVNLNSISGNSSKSFLRRGVDYSTGLNLNVQEKLFSDYQFESQMYLRKTDDKRIDSRKDIRLKQLTAKIYNDNNIVEFGDIYVDYSQFVLGSGLEGFSGTMTYDDTMKYQIVAARKNQADIAIDQYERQIYGTKAEYIFNNDYYLFPEFRLGFQVATSQDYRESVDKTVDTADLSNTVFGFEGEAKIIENLKVEYELAKSIYNEDERPHVDSDAKYGTAFRIKPSFTVENVTVRYLFYYVDPHFYTEVGSASTDKLQHQVSADWQVTENISLSVIENYYWDRLKGSLRTKKTVNEEQYITLNVRPLPSRKSFSTRTYVNLLNRNSCDKINSLESETYTYGISANDSANDGKISYGTRYEFREYSDPGNSRSGSDLYHRIGGNLAFETEFFGRRLYLSNDLSLDFRSTKQDNNPDFNTNYTFSGRYDILDRCNLKFGNNVSLYDASGPASNLTGNRSFLEAEYTFDEKRSTRCSLRLEENRYIHEDGAQSYKEDRAIFRVVTNF